MDSSKKKKSKNKQPQGNRTEAPKDYQDPTGQSEPIETPKNSGYDEKQPK